MKILVFLLMVMSFVACTTSPRYYLQDGAGLQEVMAVEENDDMVILQRMGHSMAPVYTAPRRRVRVQEYDECDHGYYEEEVHHDDFVDCHHH